MKWENNTEQDYELDYKQFLLRGTQLKNTKYVDALVVYTGTESKIVMN